MGLFSDMDKFGLGVYSDSDVINKPKNLKSEEEQEAEKKTPEEIEIDSLFDKHFTCPVCDCGFAAKVIRVGKVKLSGKDTDLRPIYEDIDPIKYDVITCDKCGYSAITRYFGKLSNRQMKDIADKIGNKFNGIDNNLALYSYDDAITRYKLALITTIVKNAKNSERAYTSLKLAWLLRGKRLTIKDDIEQIKELYKDELECLENAFNGFKVALTSEAFPIAGMDDNTLSYLMADLARRLKKYDEAQRFVATVIVSKSVGPRLKEQALTLKELLKEDIKKTR